MSLLNIGRRWSVDPPFAAPGYEGDLSPIGVSGKTTKCDGPCETCGTGFHCAGKAYCAIEEGECKCQKCNIDPI